VRTSFKHLFIIFVLILMSQTVLAQGTAEIQILWDQEILVVLNTSDEDVNVSNLDLVSANGAIMASDWVMNTYGDNNLPYSLAELQPGACLLAYPSTLEEQPDLPEEVECTVTTGMFTMTNLDDIVWDATQGGFSAQVAGATTADCDITGDSCAVSVGTTASNPVDATATEEDDTEADILVAWNTDIFVIVNPSDEEVNLSNLSFSSADGAILPENWVMNTTETNNIPYALEDVEPGSCLIAYLSADEQPELPEDIECARTEGVFTMTNANDLVWDAAQGGFDAIDDETVIATCDINNTTCVLTVATTSASEDDMTDMGDDGTQSVRAVWNTDILVIVNTSADEADLSGLSLTSSAGQILPENWVMNPSNDSNVPYALTDVAPGSCLIAYLSADEQPELPENVTCTETEGAFTMTNANDIVWDASQGGFSAVIGGATVAECDIAGNSCDIPLGG